jgi:hypothetical protein
VDVADLDPVVDGGEGESLLLEGIRVGHWHVPALELLAGFAACKRPVVANKALAR